MKKKWIGLVLGLSVFAACGTFSVQAAATDTSAAEEEEAKADIVFKAGETEVTLKNETTADEITAEVSEAAAAETAEDSADTEEAAEDAAAAYTVILTSETETHKFEAVDPSGWTDAALTEDHDFWYIQYTDAEGKSREVSETADEKEPEGELTMWTLTDVYVRDAPDSEATAVAVASLGDECKVTALVPGWFKVDYNGTEGYIGHKYLSDDKSASDAAVEQEKNAQAAQAAAAATAAAQSASYDYSYDYSGSDSGSSGSSGGSSAEACLDNGLLN